jgi:hypothetical protein
LEKVGIKHCDLKLENFLVCDSGVAKIIDFGLVEETSERSGYRKMGYARKGSRFRNQEALAAATPGFAVQKQFSVGVGYNVQNHWFFLLCDWETSWNLLYQPINEDDIKKVDEIVKKCNANSIHQIKEDKFVINSKIKEIISIPSSYSISGLLDDNLTKSCHVSELKQNATRCVIQDLQNVTKNVLDFKGTTCTLSVPISVSTLLRFAMKNDLDWAEDIYEFYSVERILETLALIIFPQSMAGFDLNRKVEESKFQVYEVEHLLKRLCKKTYLMNSGWDIIKELGPAEKNQQEKSSCKFEQEFLNENFNLTRPLTITGAFLFPKRLIDGVMYPEEVIFHQMVLDHIDNPDDYDRAVYVIANTSFKQGGPVLRIPRTRAHYADEDVLNYCKMRNEYKYYDQQQGGFAWLVNEKINPKKLQPNTLYLHLKAYSIHLHPE